MDNTVQHSVAASHYADFASTETTFNYMDEKEVVNQIRQIGEYIEQLRQYERDNHLAADND